MSGRPGAPAPDAQAVADARAAPNPEAAPDPRAGADRRAAADLTDEELDAYILARLDMAGVDLSVLPEDDPDAPADRKRILDAARRFLRSTPGDILAYEPDVQDVPPVMYPAELVGRTTETASGGEG